MSPSESDLRAALRDGEGDDLNVDRIIAGGRALRAQRRARMMTAAAVTVLVAGLGTGGAVLLSGNGNSESGSKANGGTSFDQRRAQSGTAGSLNGAAGGAAASAGNPPKAAAPNDSVTAVPCPATLPDYRLPGGGSPGQFGADGPLFSRTVDSIVVCAYGTPSAAATARPHRLVLTGGAATAVADSLEKAPRTKPTGACPFMRTADAQAIAILGVAADGTVVGTVTTTVGDPACSVRVTNGTALRYQWLPPEVLRTALAELNRGRSHGPVLKGSPISS